MISIIQTLANEVSAKPTQIQAAVELLDQGNTVPFIARYRKEVTGGLDDTQLRQLEERLRYLRELEERRDAILKSIQEQGKLTDELAADIQAADTKARLEDLYRPYKPKRRTRGQIAIESGLEPLADQLYQDPTLNPEDAAVSFVNEEKGVPDVRAALEGARFILMERWAVDPDLVGQLRERLWESGFIVSKVLAEKEKEGQKFKDYFDFREPIQHIPSHRALAILRGRNENILQISLEIEHSLESLIAHHFKIQNLNRAADPWLQEVVHWTWQVKLRVQLEVELIARMREQAEEKATQVFSENLRDVLMAPPAGYKTTLGLDPGLRTGVKMAVVDSTGKLLHHGTLFPHPPHKKWDEGLLELAQICEKHKVELISIGNGTASRETDRFVLELMQKHPEQKLTKMVVSEAGASVYSASELAAKEFPDLDVTFRGAVSIARRIQDPLAELVKIEPKSIGVGQYQHDVNQTQLARTLDGVVEDCVNAVGVDVNTASAALLARVAGLNANIAANIVTFRDQHGIFQQRDSLKEVPRLGPKAFEQAAGFLRIMKGQDPLDASGVHPEAYPVVHRILEKAGLNIQSLLGNREVLSKLKAADFTSDQFGLPTVEDILQELEKPGRDPRPEFKTAAFKQGVETLRDLKEGMILEGVVTNVANFGAFVDIGVHQDGLVHISALANRFVKDPREVVKTGDIVSVKVLEVDLDRKRIGLTMRLDDQKEGKSSVSTSTGASKKQEVSTGSQRNHPHGSQTSSSRNSGKSRNKVEVKDISMFGAALKQALMGKSESEREMS